MVTLTESEKELNQAMREMNITLKQYNMKINKTKTKVMVCSKTGQEEAAISLDGQQLQNVESFCHLQSIITRDGRSRAEIRSRIAQAKIAFNKKKSLMALNRLSLAHKKRLLKMYVLSIVPYECESWTISQGERQKLKSFELWCYWRMMKH
ncbi:hypothetical protein ILUMI_27502 [Ignelater luminosus]|uniref:Reverse transcriptase domain-containing protein n=1 Tax=Ignelater luminosus TaxID=2038154 RepID=A0A8K0C7T2_IGNLU|nr:hypothetical protein ILUMI_27502 [Ignelater luminosus]